MKFKWNYEITENSNYSQQLQKNRGIDNDFFTMGIDDLPKASKLKDVDKAAKRIIEAVRNKEKIMIFGDDDLDGITSTLILFDFLETLGSQNHYYYIPNRLVDPHGIQPEFIEKVKTEEYTLVITVDNGVTDCEAVDALNELGINVIITDHHLIPSQLPNAYAIVNPKQADCDFGYSMLAGVGVAYFLIKHIADLLYLVPSGSYLLWTAIGTVADKAPLDGVNRILVKEALATWNKNEDQTLKLLRMQQPFNGSVASKMNFISYVTRLLSGGRESNGEHLGMLLYLCNHPKKGKQLLKLTKQKREYEKMLKQVFKLMAEKTKQKVGSHYIYFDEENAIPFPLLGAAANFVVNQHKVPSLFLKMKGELLVCEARCGEGFNLVEAFDYMQDSLIQYGGHVKAAGFSAEPENIEQIIAKFIEFVELNEKIILENKKLDIDIVIDYDNLTQEFIDDLEKFQPFGMKNPEPVIILQNCEPNLLAARFYIQNNPELKPDCLYDVVFVLRSPSSIIVLDYDEKGKIDNCIAG